MDPQYSQYDPQHSQSQHSRQHSQVDRRKSASLTMSVILLREGVDTVSDGCHPIMGMCCYPILTISACVSVSVFSRRLERLYPRSASSKKRVSSLVFFSELPKNWKLLRSAIVVAVVINFTFVPVLTQCFSLNKWNLKIIRQVLKKMHVRVSLSLVFSHVNDIKYIIVQ